MAEAGVCAERSRWAHPQPHGPRIATGREIAPILGWLRDSIEICGKPLQLMSDNGSEFVH